MVADKNAAPVRFLGVDPGVNGGLAAVDAAGVLFGALRMPETDEEYLEAVDLFTDDGARCVAVLEQVHAGVWGKAGRMGVSSAFTFGGAYRAIRVALLARGVRVVDVRPVRWQTALGCRPPAGVGPRERKAWLRDRAAEVFPDIRVTLALADALLLAEFCRRTEGRA